jgi:hypothetical protein
MGENEPNLVTLIPIKTDYRIVYVCRYICKRMAKHASRKKAFLTFFRWKEKATRNCTSAHGDQIGRIFVNGRLLSLGSF